MKQLDHHRAAQQGWDTSLLWQCRKTNNSSEPRPVFILKLFQKEQYLHGAGIYIALNSKHSDAKTALDNNPPLGGRVAEVANALEWNNLLILKLRIYFHNIIFLLKVDQCKSICDLNENIGCSNSDQHQSSYLKLFPHSYLLWLALCFFICFFKLLEFVQK